METKTPISLSHDCPPHKVRPVRMMDTERLSRRSLPPGRCSVQLKAHPKAPDTQATLDEARVRDEQFMELALACAKMAATAGEVPIGAVMVLDGDIVCRCWNTMETSGDPTKHAEMTAVQQAALKLGRFKLPECTLYVTLEPCPMCAGAILQARVGTLVYAASNHLLGADGSWTSLLRSGEGTPLKPHPFHPRLQIRRGILASRSEAMMKQFFQDRRQQPSSSCLADGIGE